MTRELLDTIGFVDISSPSADNTSLEDGHKT